MPTVSDKDPAVFDALAKRLQGKLFADKGYISQKLFDSPFEEGIQLVTGLRVNMKNKLMPFYDNMLLRKRYIIETINDLLKNTAQIVHSRHRSVANFIINSHATRESRMVFYHHYLSYLYTPFIYGNVICQCI